jgi:putative ABC transport system permease protein
MLRLALHSLRNRWLTALLVLATITVSVALLLSVQWVRTASKESFNSALSGTDLIVGARTGDVNLLLLSVFRMGDANANVSWNTYQKIAHHRDVAWTVPLSLGDSHAGFRVLGTTSEYLIHYRYNQTQQLRFTQGRIFQDTQESVVGAEVAEKLGYRAGDMITLSHGTGQVSFLEHADNPFRISGVLARTGTPVDRTVHVGLDAIALLHSIKHGNKPPEPDSITAFLIGMRSRDMTLTMQRAINTYRDEPLTAIMPEVALEQLWSLVGTADKALMIVSAFVVGAGLLGMMTSILAGLNERRREMAILRAIGARPLQVFGLLLAESGLLASAGALLGAALSILVVLVIRPLIRARYGIDVPMHAPTSDESMLLAAVVAGGFLAGLIPAWRAYASSLGDGLQLRT